MCLDFQKMKRARTVYRTVLAMSMFQAPQVPCESIVIPKFTYKRFSFACVRGISETNLPIDMYISFFSLIVFRVLILAHRSFHLLIALDIPSAERGIS